MTAAGYKERIDAALAGAFSAALELPLVGLADAMRSPKEPTARVKFRSR